MADNDLQAELDNLLGGLDEKQGAAEAPKEAPAEETPVPDSATSAGNAAPRKGMLGGGAKPLGKGKLGAAAARPAGGTASATGVRPPAGNAPAAPARPAAGNAPAAPARPAAGSAPAAPVAVPPGMAATPKPSVVPLILSGLSLVFTLVAIVMITQVNNSVKSLQTSITASLKAQQDKTHEQIKALNDQTKALKNIQETLKTQMLDRDSEFQKQMRMSRESLDELLEKLGKK